MREKNRTKRLSLLLTVIVLLIVVSFVFAACSLFTDAIKGVFSGDSAQQTTSTTQQDKTSSGDKDSGSGSWSGGGSGGSGSGSGSSDPVTPVTVAAPQFSGETQFTESTSVTMTGPDGATIYYTTDGSVPSAASGQVYSEPVTLTETTTVKAVAVKDGVSSSVTERTYTKGTSGGMDEN